MNRFLIAPILLSLIVIGCSWPVDFVDDDTSDWVWSDRWIQFMEEPTVCDGVLRTQGHARNGASFGHREATFATFAIYRREDSRPRDGWGQFVAEPVLGFLEPLGPGEYYPDLDDGDRIATRLIASPRYPEFELVSGVPGYIAAVPDDYVLGIWGYRRHGEAPKTLRDRVLRPC